MMKTFTITAAALAMSLSAGAESTNSAQDAAWQPYDGARISFDILRKGKPFGKHVVSFAADDAGDLTVTTDVDLKIKIGPFTAFQYQLDSTETWQDGQLVALNGKTNDDGRKAFVSAALSGQELRVEGSAYQGAVSARVIPSSHWNINQVRTDRMLSTESGELLAMDIVPKGREVLNIGGRSILTNRYLLDSDIDIDLWYDDAGRWVKLMFEARGQTIEYRLSELY